jgi:hypothetical protein
MSHLLEHGAAVMDEVVQIVETGAADVKLRHFQCCREIVASGRDNLVRRDWRLEGRRIEYWDSSAMENMDAEICD